MARGNSVPAAGPVIVLDNGGGTVKLGLAGQDAPSKVFTNAAARVKGERKVVWGDALDDLPDIGSITLQHPIDRGYVVNWDLQRQVWEHSIKAQLHLQPSDASLLVTEPVFNFTACQEACQQVVFEDMGMQGLAVATGPELVLRHHLTQKPSAAFHAAAAGLVVDAGFSFIHVVPFLDSQVLESGVRRIDLGGKFMTNYLKELVSFRSLNMMDEAYLVEHVKQAACFVSQDLRADLKAAKASARHKAEYVLPDGLSASRGFLRAPQPRSREQQDRHEQVLLLNNERFLVPELAFSPSDIGLRQGGLAQQVADAALSQHPDIQPLLLANVICAGGLAACPGFVARLETELRPLVPDHTEVLVHSFQEPALAAWHGGSELAASPQFGARLVTKAQYQEWGPREV